MWRNIHSGNVESIQAKSLRTAAAGAAASGRAVQLHTCPSPFDPAGLVETMVIDGSRAGQTSDLAPDIAWGQWDPVHEVLRLDGGGTVGLRGEQLEALLAEDVLAQKVRDAVGRSRDMLELFYAVRQHIPLISRLSPEQRRRFLPRFDDSAPPWNMEGVWAWGGPYVIVLLDGELQLVPRQHWDR